MLAAGEKLLIIGRLVLLVEAGGQPEISQFYVTATVKQDVVRFDVPGPRSGSVHLQKNWDPLTTLTDG